MKKPHTKVYLSFLIIALLVFATRTGGAETMSSFVIGQDQTGQRWEIMAEGERSWVSMSAANNYITWINSTWGGTISKMDTADGFSVRAVYRVNPFIGFGIGYERFWAEASGWHMMGFYKMETSADGALAVFSVRYPLLPHRIFFNGELALGYYFANIKESENAWKQKGTDATLGFRLEGKVCFAVTKNFSIVAGGGYRFLKTDNFGINFFSPGNPKAEMDYSGWFAGGGVSVTW